MGHRLHSLSLLASGGAAEARVSRARIKHRFNEHFTGNEVYMYLISRALPVTFLVSAIKLISAFLNTLSQHPSASRRLTPMHPVRSPFRYLS
jgi:hypothetical protein